MKNAAAFDMIISNAAASCDASILMEDNMDDPKKIYRITLRHSASMPTNWPNLLSSTSGITLKSTTGRHARIEATPDAIQALQRILGDDMIIEEEIPRLF